MYNHAPEGYHDPYLCVAKGNKCKRALITKEDIFYSDDKIMAFISSYWWPNNAGSVQIIPKEGYENLYDIPDDLLSYIHIFSKKVAVAMKETYKCDGVSIRQHNEPAGNQEVWHYHLHVFPRYDGDDLYIRHEEKRPSTPEDRKMYAERLRTYINENNQS